MTSRSIILGIETAIGGGSISFLREDGIENGTLVGISRAEEVLIGVDGLLADCDLSLDEIEMIAVSLGPGSFTGIRIGIATALGLKSSLGAKCVGVNALEGIAASCRNENMIAVLPLGRGRFVFQQFYRHGPSGSPNVVSEEEFTQILGNLSDVKILFHSEFGSAAGAQWKPLGNLEGCTERLSTLIGRCALAGGGTEDIRPLYLRNQSKSQGK